MDFGLSNKFIEVQNSTNTTNSKFGIIPYLDPKSFDNNNCIIINQNQNFKLSKKSNVYSVGILIWQISSGYEPFTNPKDIEDDDDDGSISFDVDEIFDDKSEDVDDETFVYKPYSEDIEDNHTLILKIINGKREKIIYGTPIEYSVLYKGTVFILFL
ncbi:hypothetical protein C1645_160274 [Glomus cerebriforme]|uniref:Protein kinase domain-containing protein n=1 Tax=Glomus cerebriforme TaxID=658196 RepID=A0A397S3G2_9GLOM|nr:hypothetical protein C1645_160274 [Glomus cerebriforme]